MLAFGFLVLAVSVLIAYRAMVLQDKARILVRHTLQVENELTDIGRFVTLAEASQRGYLITVQPAYLQSYRAAQGRLPGIMATLTKLVRDNPPQVSRATELGVLIERRMAILHEGIDLVSAGKGEEAFALVKSGKGHDVTIRFSTVLADMRAEEDKLLQGRAALAALRTDYARVVLVVSFFLALILAFFALRGAMARIVALDATIAKLNEESHARGQAQSQVQQLQKMEAVGQLTGGIAHDFNNMLAIIVGSLDLARRRLRDGDTEKAVAILDHAQDGADRAAALTAQLLAFARRQPLEPKTLEPNRLVGGISELLRRTLGEQIQIETVLAGGLWRVHADPEQLESALVNLAVNGRDAMPGGGKLTIETANSELDERYAASHEEVTPGQYVMISVTDTGVGMTPDVIEQAFEPFFTTKEVGRGTGLGLSQVFGFVKQSDGHVKIYSEPGQGTTVKIYLPREAGVAVSVGRIASADVPVGRPDELVLVVEDEARVRRVSVDALVELGYGVIEAANGQEALTILADNPGIRLLFTDIVMPGMSGRLLVDKAHETRPDLKVLYTTGYTRNAIVHNGVVDYGVAFIQKPFTIQALARKVREVLDDD
nr:CHASE3 domain-containing protein [Sphingobium nicotianae]